MPRFRAFVVSSEDGAGRVWPVHTPIDDMRGVVLDSPEAVRAWLIGPPAGYLKTHPELDGQRVIVSEDTDG
jgi:hypothetical protein